MCSFIIVASIFTYSTTCFAAPVLPLVFQPRRPVTIPAGGPAVVQVGQTGSLVAVPVSYKPYEFGYEFGDGLGMSQHRKEVADSFGSVRGSYGYLDPLGVTRHVEYRADNDGYRAVVKSNEPGLAGQNAADAVFLVQPPPPAAVAQGIRRFITIVPV